MFTGLSVDSVAGIVAACSSRLSASRMLAIVIRIMILVSVLLLASDVCTNWQQLQQRTPSP